VDARWESVATSILFHTFKSDLVETGTRKFDDIWISRAGGILDRIKRMKIKTATNDTLEEQSRNLLRLIRVLPLGSLTRLHFDSYVDRDVLGVCLRAQSQLR
jgi:hypothetical protein